MTIGEMLLARAAAYPGFENIRFGSLPEAGGTALLPLGDKALESVRRSVTGRVRRVYRWPFALAGRYLDGDPVSRAGRKQAMEDLAAHMERTAPGDIDGGRLLDVERVRTAAMEVPDGGHGEVWSAELCARYELFFEEEHP